MKIVLNLIITGMPSILMVILSLELTETVLNLIITGMPSIQRISKSIQRFIRSFKPYYNWNAFNT